MTGYVKRLLKAFSRSPENIDYCVSIKRCSTREAVKKYYHDMDNLPCKGDYKACPVYIHKKKIFDQTIDLEKEVMRQLETKSDL